MNRKCKARESVEGIAECCCPHRHRSDYADRKSNIFTTEPSGCPVDLEDRRDLLLATLEISVTNWASRLKNRRTRYVRFLPVIGTCSRPRYIQFCPIVLYL